MKNNQFFEAIETYNSIPIPDETLKARIEGAIAEGKRSRQIVFRTVRRSLFAAAVAAMLVFTISLNTITGLAATLDDIPVLGNIVRVLTFRTFEEHNPDRAYELDIAVPEVSGLADAELENALNQKYLAESQAQYQSFMDDINAIKNDELVYKAVDAGYNVLVNDGELLVIQRYKTEGRASSSESSVYDTIDTKNNLVLTLPGLFTDDQYIERISHEIKRQMRENIDRDSSLNYFLTPAFPGDTDYFDAIKPNQQFYINAEHKLVIAFDSFEAAPGYMGAVEFIIPTETIKDCLTSSYYIK